MEYLNPIEETEEHGKEAKNQPSPMKELFDWLDIIVASIVSVVIIFTFLFRVVTIVGGSMKNTFYNGEKIVISNLFYTPEFGDVVVISRNANNTTDELSAVNEPLIKRVIATGEQYVDIDFEKGKVYVGYSSNRADMIELDEPYTKTPTNLESDVQFPLYVPEGYVFVLGDNRNDSKDSRFSEIGENGLVNEKYILGKAVFRLFPLKRAGRIEDIDGGLE